MIVIGHILLLLTVTVGANITSLTMIAPDVMYMYEKYNLTCIAANGLPPAQIHWDLEGRNFSGSPIINETLPGINDTTTVINAINYYADVWQKGMTMKCTASQYGVKIAEQGVKLDLLFIPVLQLSIHGHNNVPKFDALQYFNVSLWCKVLEAHPNPERYVFFHDMEERQNGSSSMYILSNVTKFDVGQYLCAAGNEGGVGKSPATFIDVLYPPIIDIQPWSEVNITEGSSVHLNCIVDANPAEDQIIWTKDERNISYDGVLSLYNITLDQAGVYTCIASNFMEPDLGPSLIGITEKDVQINVQHIYSEHESRRPASTSVTQYENLGPREKEQTSQYENAVFTDTQDIED